MKILILLFFILVLNYAFAGNISFTKPCDLKVQNHLELDFNGTLSVAELTLNTLTQLNINHEGNLQGINSIYQTPTGLEAMDVISDSEMLAYGWCYSVNGVSPEILPGDMFVSSKDKIVWWYGYAQYKDGTWVTQCTPSVTQKKSSFCKKLTID